MTITAMIVMMLYWAFAMGSRVWEVQDMQTTQAQREEAFFRLLDQDFRGLVPYTSRWERGVTEFFAGGPTAIYYVTRGGFGAQAREGKALFFACLFLEPNPEEGWNMALYKVPVPEPELLENVHAFQTGGDFVRHDWLPTNAIQENAVVFLEKLSHAEFFFAPESPRPLRGTEVPVGLLDGFSEQNGYTQEWLGRILPGMVLVRYELGDRLTEIALVPGIGAM